MISKYMLEKDGRTAVLCGVRHVESKTLYEEIQRAIDQAVADSHLFFYEGIRRDPSVKFGPGNAKRLLAFWSKMTKIGYPALAEMKELETQRRSLRYPPEGINADISLD